MPASESRVRNISYSVQAQRARAERDQDFLYVEFIAADRVAGCGQRAAADSGNFQSAAVDLAECDRGAWHSRSDRAGGKTDQRSG